MAIVIMLWKCCSLCSGFCKELKKESLSKLVEEKRFPSFSLQVAFLSVLGESMFGAGSVLDQCRKTSLCFLLALFAIISIHNSSGCELLCGHCAAVFSGAFVGFLALVVLLSYAFERLDRHVLGYGEQASGRVDVPGKDKQQQAAAAKDSFVCFFFRSLGGASFVVKMEHQGHCRTGQAARSTQVWGL